MLLLSLFFYKIFVQSIANSFDTVFLLSVISERIICAVFGFWHAYCTEMYICSEGIALAPI